MAFVDHLAGETPVAYTIHVWPTDDLRARSWGWSERRRKAYAQMAAAIALSVATQILEGGSFISQEIAFSCSIGTVEFAISQSGTTIRITISEFTNPDGPPPNGGEEAQPCAIDGLVLGLSGANGYFYVAAFHGVLPPMPTSSVLDVEIGDQIIGCILGVSSFARPNRLSPIIANMNSDQRLNFTELDYRFESADISGDAGARASGGRFDQSNRALTMLIFRDLEIQPKIESAEAAGVETPEKGFGIFCRAQQWETRVYGLPALSAACLPQHQANQIQGRYLH